MELSLCSSPRTDQMQLLMRRSAKAQMGRNDLAVRDGLPLRYLSIVTGAIKADHYVTTGSHLYVYCSGSQAKRLREILVMEEAETPLTSVFATDGYVQHPGSERREELCTRYPRYLNAENQKLLESVASARGEGTTSI